MAFFLRFLCVGPQRSGTTWLYRCLSEHPQLCFPQGVKETFFFDERFHKGWSWYRSHFKHMANDQMCAEVAPTYFDIDGAAIRIKEHNPDCRIIVTLRDPVTRSFSLYLHHRKKGRLKTKFSEASHEMPRIIDSSRYRKHLKRWIDLFGREQILIILHEDMASYPENVLNNLYDFLGINQIALPKAAKARVNAASLPAFPALAKVATYGADSLREKRLYGPIEVAKKLGFKWVYKGYKGDLPTLNIDLRRNLIKEFERDISFVENILKRSLSEWRKIT